MEKDEEVDKKIIDTLISLLMPYGNTYCTMQFSCQQSSNTQYFYDNFLFFLIDNILFTTLALNHFIPFRKKVSQNNFSISFAYLLLTISFLFRSTFYNSFLLNLYCSHLNLIFMNFSTIQVCAWT